ncbi:GNAT family N-acetyltransferase [Amycolatopsis rhabdoformis]|uniref:GNAT family N-acetyltransferase n=1 Tax=Amycolatopsis rhabdoformis TaxID=1448059 RepID=A0ABZ1IKI0_9PSEU|nr:GNAT family N-acetyltransferase [Amycolatopsis rhabdoformis]WSE34281.1 GNAT family N-acetyltransferase [Amycolatopsis rhabdoformis]
MVELRILTADDWRAWRALRLGALAEAPLAFGARLADWQGEGDTEARWRARLTDLPFNVLASVTGQDAGMASATDPDDEGVVDLLSMYVTPFARGHGVGGALVGAVADWAARRAAQTLRLQVFEDNAAAIALYRRHGFLDAGTVQYRRLALKMVRGLRHPSRTA